MITTASGYNFLCTIKSEFLNMKKSRRKNSRDRVRKYGLVSQRYVSFLRAERLLRVKGMVINEVNKNCLFMYNNRESTKHWVIKALLFKLLRERGRTVGTEVEIKGAIVDVLDVDNLIGYEIESNFNSKAVDCKLKRLWKLHDVFFIDVKKVPDNVLEAEKYLEKFVV